MGWFFFIACDSQGRQDFIITQTIRGESRDGHSILGYRNQLILKIPESLLWRGAVVTLTCCDTKISRLKQPQTFVAKRGVVCSNPIRLDAFLRCGQLDRRDKSCRHDGQRYFPFASTYEHFVPPKPLTSMLEPRSFLGHDIL